MPASEEARIWLVRHGETEWSVTGQHTGRSDIALTDKGREIAQGLRGHLKDEKFALVLTSPLQRARETCAIAGFADVAIAEPDLQEWDYGLFEGRTTAEIREDDPDWIIWDSPIPGGESLLDAGLRAERVIDRAVQADGDVLLFGHGHILRILAAAWLGLPFDAARLFALDTAAISILGYERETRVIRMWNYT